MSDFVDKAIAWDMLAVKNARIKRLENALKEIDGLDFGLCGDIARSALSTPRMDEPQTVGADPSGREATAEGTS